MTDRYGTFVASPLGRRLTAERPGRYRPVFIGVTLLAFAVSFVGFGDLMNVVYPALGYLGIVLALVLIAWTKSEGDLRGVVTAIALSKATIRTVRQNLFWAFIYNLVGIPLAAFGFLSPVVAGAAMALSGVSVVSNALLLRSWKPEE